MKICTACQISQPKESFTTAPRNKYGRISWCKACFRLYKKKRHEEFVEFPPVEQWSKRFWSYVEITLDNPKTCWPWLGGKLKNGYGSFILSYKTLQASQAAYIQAFGYIPKGLLVLHRCDNPPCCRPSHLFVGTNADNMRDALEKGKFIRKLSNQDVVFIINMRGIQSAKELAKRFNVHWRTVYAIWYRERKQSVPIPTIGLPLIPTP